MQEPCNDMSAAIEVENLSKRYRLEFIGGKTLKEDLGRWWAKVRGRGHECTSRARCGRAPRSGDSFGGRGLAVGDADFQRRCIGKMEEVA